MSTDERQSDGILGEGSGDERIPVIGKVAVEIPDVADPVAVPGLEKGVVVAPVTDAERRAAEPDGSGLGTWDKVNIARALISWYARNIQGQPMNRILNGAITTLCGIAYGFYDGYQQYVAAGNAITFKAALHILAFSAIGYFLPQTRSKK